MPYLFLDARYERVRLEVRIVDCAVLIAVGIDATGKRRVVGCTVATNEAEINWRRFLESLLARGLHGVKLIVADDHAGLKAARRAVLPAVPWQRCQFHLQQNAGQFVTRQEARKTVATQLRTIFNAPDKMEAERLLRSALEAWREEHPKLAEWAEVAVPESLTVFDFPAAHRVRLRTTRPYTHQPGTATTHPLPASSPTPIPACVWSRPFLPNSTTSETYKVYLNLNP